MWKISFKLKLPRSQDFAWVFQTVVILTALQSVDPEENVNLPKESNTDG